VSVGTSNPENWTGTGNYPDVYVTDTIYRSENHCMVVDDSTGGGFSSGDGQGVKKTGISLTSNDAYMILTMRKTGSYDSDKSILRNGSEIVEPTAYPPSDDRWYNLVLPLDSDTTDLEFQEFVPTNSNSDLSDACWIDDVYLIQR
jgi:hypothetical protein